MPISVPAIRPDLLLEREQHLHVLQDAFSRANSSNGCTVLVVGEAGIGKTTLVEHFIARLDQDVRVLKGACDALSTPTALGPLFDIAQQLGGAMAERLKETSPRPALFGSVLESVANRNGMTVLFIEDLHWADHATLDLVKFLVRRTIDRRTLLIFTLRDDEIGAVHPLRRVLGDLAGQRSVSRLKPAPLTIEAVVTMIGRREQNAEDVHRKTGGNPFYVTEVIGQVGSAIPSTVRDAVLARAARLSRGARQLVELVSVVGARVDNALLERIEWISPDQTEEAVGTGSLIAKETGLGFRHELARMAIFESIDPLQRRSLFRQVLRSAAEIPDLVTSAQLAHYAEGAGDAAAVVRHGLQAAKAAAALGAHREAASHYQRMLAFSQDRSTSERAGYIEALAREWAIVDNLDEAIRTYRAAISLRAQAGDTLREGADWADLAWPLVRSGQNAAADDASRRAIQVLRGLPASKELGRAYRLQAHLRMLDRQGAQAVAWGKKAIAAANDFGDAEGAAGGELVVGAAMLVSGDDRGRAHLIRCLMQARKEGFDDLTALVYVNLGSSYGELYRFAEAERELSEGLAFTHDRDLDHSRHYMTAWLALTRLYQGRWVEATELAASVLAEPHCASVSRIMALAALGRVRARRGDPGTWAALDDALELASQTKALQRLAPVHAARAEAAYIEGDIRKTASEARAVYDLALKLRHRWHVGEFCYWRTLAHDRSPPPRWVARPFALQLQGRWNQAAELWGELDCPYEKARALADGDVDAQMEAIQILTHLGAGPLARALSQRVREAGIRHIPRGPRASTKSNPLGLTDRQMTILDLICEGLSNKQIAGKLKLSPKTVDHHVSAVLIKMDVSTRQEAAKRARDGRIASQNRESPIRHR